MSYPPRYTPRTDFALAAQNGEDVDGTKLASELADIAEVINQQIGFIKAGFTSDRRWQPSSATAQTLVDQTSATATADQTVFPYDTGVTADPLTDKARVFSNGILVRPADVTVGETGVTIPARSGGELVVVELYNDQQNVRSDLASVLTDLGASLIGVQDVLAFFNGDNLEDVLAEIGSSIQSINDAAVDFTSFIRADGSVAFVDDQDLGGNRITGLADGIASTDAATVSQLNALSAVYGDLGQIFLQLAGGSMAGPIGMASNKITDLGAPTNDNDAARLVEINNLLSSVTADFLKKAGDTLTGPLNVNGQALNNLAAATEDDQPPRLDQVQALVDAVETSPSYIGGIKTDSTSFPDVTVEDRIHDFGGDLDWPVAATEIAHAVTIRVQGNLDLAGKTLRVLQVANSSAAASGWANSTVRSVLGSTTVFGQDSAIIDASKKTGGGGAGGRGGAAEDNSASYSEGIAHEEGFPVGMWRSGAFFAGGRGLPRASEPNGINGRGGIRILVDGNIDLTGATIDASSESAGDDTSYNGSTEGAGSIVLIAKGNIICGTGALLKADGSRGDTDDADDPGGSGAGYIAVVANRITGTLNISAKGGAAFADSYEGGGGYVEISRAEVADGDIEPATDVSPGDAGGNSAQTPVEDWTGLVRKATHDSNRLPFFGVK